MPSHLRHLRPQGPLRAEVLHEGTGSLIIIPLDSRLVTTQTPCRGVVGRTFELTTASGKAYFYDEQGNWDASLEETSCWGWGGFWTEVYVDCEAADRSSR
ncbi:MAG: hypothetical protein WBN70_13415 [Polyangiales bacterium]